MKDSDLASLLRVIQSTFRKHSLLKLRTFKMKIRTKFLYFTVFLSVTDQSFGVRQACKFNKINCILASSYFIMGSGNSSDDNRILLLVILQEYMGKHIYFMHSSEVRKEEFVQRAACRSCNCRILEIVEFRMKLNLV